MKLQDNRYMGKLLRPSFYIFRPVGLKFVATLIAILALISVVSSAQAAITFREKSLAKNDGVSSLSPAMPTGTVVGDLMIATVTHDVGGTTLSAPAGWTLIQPASPGSEAIRTRSWYRVAEAGESGPYTFTASDTDSMLAQIVTFYESTGVNVAGWTLEDSSYTYQEGSDSMTSTSVTGVPGCLLYLAEAHDDNQGVSAAPSGMTMLYEEQTTGNALATYYEFRDGGGVSKDITWQTVDELAAVAAIFSWSATSGATNFTQDANIVSWWYLAESSGTRYDGSGTNNNDLADNNSVTSYSRPTNPVKEGLAAASFATGNSETLTITDAAQSGLDITGNLTLAAWIRPTNTSGDRTIIAKSDGASNRSYHLYIETPGPILKGKVSSGGSGTVQPYGATTLALDTWHHVALVYDGSELRIYLNGSVDENGSNNPLEFSGGIFNGNAPFAIGSRGNVDQYFDGQIDEVAVFDRALSPAEITAIYENGLNGVTRMRPDAAQPPVPYFGRSIGENGGTIYGTGTVTLNQGSRRATFSGATLPTNIGEGDKLLIDGTYTYYISSRESTTEVIVQEANVSGDHSGLGYTITRAYSGTDHTPFVNWESAREGDLVTDDVIERGICYKDNDGEFEFTSQFEIDGSTTDSSHFLWLTVADSERHDGRAGTGVAIDGNGGNNGIRARDDYTRIEWLEVKNVRNVGSAAALIAREVSNVLFQYVIVHDFDDASNDVYGVRTLTFTGSSDLIVRNSIIYDGDHAAIKGDDANDTVTVENCTIYGMADYGIYLDLTTASNFTVRNTISLNNGGTDTDFDAGMTQSYNISEDSTASGTGSLTGRTATASAEPGAGDWVVFTNLTAGSEDFHLRNIAENDALNAGDDLSSSFTGDIDGQTRPTGAGTWDIGADEYAADATAIYYSVGTTATALYSDTASASGGTLTLNSAADDKIGVGDEVRVGSDRYYITGRNSSTEFAIQNSAANGGTPGDANITFSSQSITIYRAFNSLTAAISGSIDSSHLNLAGGNLVAGNYQLNWPCYKDAALDDLPAISGYTTGADNYIRVYTPVDTSEVGTSQRHNGAAGTGFVLQYTPDPNTADLFEINEDYVRIEGIEIDGSQTQPSGIYGLYVKGVNNTLSDVRIDKVIVHDLTKDDDVENKFFAIGIYFSDGSGRVTNSIVYDITNNNTNPTEGEASAAGIRCSSSGSINLYNNTVYNVVNNGTSAAVYGIWRYSGTVTATNNYAGGTSCSSCGANNYDFSGSMTQSYNISEDATASGTGSLTGKAPADQFVSITGGSENLHLKTGADCLNVGDDLSSNFTDDIDGDTRPTGANTWDIGADEYFATTYYRSVGTDTGDLASGDGISVKATVSAGSTTVTFTGLSLPAMDQVGAMGPGDKITLDPGGANEDVRYILSRDSATQVTLQSPVDNDHTAEANQDFNIKRAYNTLSGWESARQRDLTLATGDDSIEVAVCYKDGVLQETDVVQIADWTTGANNYIRIWVPEGQRHTGTAGTGFVLKPVTTTPQEWFVIFWIDKIMFASKGSKSTAPASKTHNLLGVLIPVTLQARVTSGSISVSFTI
jgi:hypothetical protein